MIPSFATISCLSAGPLRSTWPLAQSPGTVPPTKDGPERNDYRKFVELADVTSGIRGHSLKLYKPGYQTTPRQTFFSVCVVSEWNVVDAPSLNAFFNHHWTDIGVFS